MTISTTSLTESEYKDKRYELIKLVEEGGHENVDLYADSKGLVTTGVGFNLHVSSVLNSVLTTGFDVAPNDLVVYHDALSAVIVSVKGKTNAEIQTAMDAEWQRLTGDNSADNTFTFSDGNGKTALEKIRAVFDNLADTIFEVSLENRLSAAGVTGYSDSSYSNERLALISLEYNNGNALIGPGLKSALSSGNRFEAWYQIRYVSNGDALSGIAKRRYFESSLFGLFNSGSPSDTEAKQVIDSFLDTTHFNKIQSYENTYGSAVASANNDYASYSGFSPIANIGEIFKPITSYLIERFKPDDSTINLSQYAGSIDGEVIVGIENSSGQIASRVKGVVGEDKGDLLIAVKDEDSVLSGRYGNDVLIGKDKSDQLYGGEDNDVLVGQGGEDTLYGGTGEDKLYGGDGVDILYAEGQSSTSDTSKDELYGGKGDDKLYGDAGDDTLDGGEDADRLEGKDGNDIYKADDKDTILDSGNDGRVELNGNTLSGGSRSENDPANTYKDGNTTYVLNGSTLTVNDGLVIEDFESGDLGIDLTEDDDDDDDDAPDVDDAQDTTSPIILDLDGDGVETLTIENYFDHDGDGFQERTGWVGAGDGLLARDLNGDGNINNGTELFGSNTVLASSEQAADGFQALDDLDSNEDGVISSADEAWEELRVWQDSNGNAVVDDGELATLEEHNIASLSLTVQESDFIDDSFNEHRLTSTMTMTDGTEQQTADVWFQVNRAIRLQSDVDLSDDVLALPDARGFGSMSDLRAAMSDNDTLKTLVEQFSAETDTTARNAILEALIFEWAGVTDVDPYSRDPSRIYGHVMDARQLETLEALIGQDYLGTWCWGERDPNPHGQAAPKLIAEFEKYAAFVESQLLAQTQYEDEFAWIYSNYNTDGKKIFADLEQFQSEILELQANGELEKIAEIARIAQGLGTYSAQFRESLAGSFAILIAVEPELAALLDGTVVEGTEGSDYLRGSYEDKAEVIIGKEGDDSLYGYGGDDVYYFEQGHGSDRIWDSSGNDTLRLGDGYTSDNVRLSRDATTVWLERVDDNGDFTGDKIQIDNFFNFDGSLDSPVESILFNSDERWSIDDIKAQLLSLIDESDNKVYGSETADQLDALAGDDVIWGFAGDDLLQGNEGDDNLNGGEGNDTLVGGIGADELTGGNGADTYVFSNGDGEDLVNNYDEDAASADTIAFDSSVNVSDIRLERSGEQLIIHGLNTDKIIVKSFFSDDATSPYAIDSIIFNDGTVWDQGYILDAVKVVSDGADLVIGYDSQGEIISTLAGDDTVYARGGDDLVLGNAGADRLYGEEGNDELQGGDDNDYLSGGDGDDRLFGEAGNDSLIGDDGDDLLSGGEGDDTLSGGRGHDDLVGGVGNDYLSGGRGDDNYYFTQGDGHDVISDQEGELKIYVSDLDPEDAIFRRQGRHLLITFSGNSEDDIITINNWFDPVSAYAFSGISLGTSSAGLFYYSSSLIQLGTMEATAFSDTLLGNADNNVISGLEGNDYIQGDLGDDILNGDEGNDTIYGGDGADSLAGGEGDDTLYAGSGDDYLSGDTGTDVLQGGEGNDSYAYSVGGGEDLIVDSAGEDQLSMLDFASSDLIFRREGDDLILLDRAVETARQASGDIEPAVILIRVVGQFAGANEQPVSAVEAFIFKDGETLSFDDVLPRVLLGTELNDTIEGHATDDAIDSGAGDDVVTSGLGNDTLSTGSGDDIVSAGAGDDYIDAGQGNDTIDAGSGNDTVLAGDGDDDINAGFGDDTVDAGAGDDVILGGSGDDSLAGGLGNDTITDFSGENNLSGGDGADQLYGYGTLDGGASNDILQGEGVLFGGDGDDTISGSGELYGDAGNDTLTGSGLLVGGAGDDLITSESASTIEGGTGNDTIYGSFGNEVYVFNLGDGEDTIIERRSGEAYSNVDPSNDSLVFGDGISQNDVLFERHGNNLVVVLANGTDKITVQDWYEEPTEHYKINNFIFAGGTQLSDADVENSAITYGTEADDVLTGYRDENDEIHAGLGDDKVWGRTGDDVIYGDEGDDYLDGDEGDDALYGGEGEDNLVGRVGDDYLAGEAGNDSLQGMDGADILIGGAGDDSLFGGDGNDQLQGGDNNDYLDAGDGADTLNGGAGNDQLAGGLGNDTYITGSGDDTIVITDDGGHDTIDVSGGGANGIYFDGTLTLDRLGFSQDGNDLFILVDDGNAQSIRVVDHFLGGEFALDWLQPKNENIINTAQINQLAAGETNPDFDTVIVGTSAGEQLQGSSGTDLIQGLEGDDQLYGFSGDDQLEGGDGDDRLQGGNGSNSGSGDDVLIGGEGNDILVGEDGNDTLDGGNGNDHYYYYSGTGTDTVNDSGNGQDVLFFNDAGPERLSFHQDGNDLIVLVDGDIEQQVRVVDHFLGGDSEIMVQPSSGNTLTTASIAELLTDLPTEGEGEGGEGEGNSSSGGSDSLAAITDISGDDNLEGSANNDVLVSGEGDDTLAGFEGSDRLIGGNGNDTYLIGRSSGADTIVDASGQNIVRFVDGIVFGDVSSGLTKSGNDLVLLIGSAGDQVRVQNFFTVNNTIETFEFETGGELTAAQLYGAFGLSAPTSTTTEGSVIFGDGQDNTLEGSSDNDALLGGQGNDTLSGLGADDQLIGGAGDDVYLVGSNSGSDVVVDTQGTNIIRFVDGIAFGDVSSGLTKSGNDLVLMIGSGGDQVRVENFFSLTNTIESLEFESGGEITAAQLHGVFGVSAPTESLVTHDALSYVISGSDSDDVIDGSDNNDHISGGGGNDVISGSAGDDILVGESGNDILDGGAGSDRFVFGLGDGQDTINQFDETADSTDTLVISDDVSLEELWFSRAGDDLQINIEGSDDQVLVDNWYLGSSYQLDEIELGDSVLLNGQVDQLVSAMASFDVPSGVGSVIPSDVRGQLQPVLAEVWQNV